MISPYENREALIHSGSGTVLRKAQNCPPTFTEIPVNLEHTVVCLFAAAHPTPKDCTLCASSEIHYKTKAAFSGGFERRGGDSNPRMSITPLTT